MRTVGCKGYDYKNFLLKGNETALKRLVRDKGPVPAAIEITPLFMAYSEGIFYDPSCGKRPNHAILITGFGSEDGIDYWLVF